MEPPQKFLKVTYSNPPWAASLTVTIPYTPNDTVLNIKQSFFRLTGINGQIHLVRLMVIGFSISSLDRR
jgi:hypothetical protein